MQIRSTLILLALLVCPAMATLTADVYLSDGNTPLALRDPNVPHVYRDVMVGTKLCVIVSSDIRELTQAVISMSWSDHAKGELTARDYNEVTREWEGSYLKAAGSDAFVGSFSGDTATGYNIMAGGARFSAGQWFIFDYRAKTTGTCHIILSESPGVPTPDPWGPSPPPAEPIVVTTLTLNHVASRDFNGDTVVNFKDFALFAERWRTKANPDADGLSTSFDLDADGYSGIPDLALFSRFWLDRTDVNVPLPDPNTPSMPLQP